MPKSKSQKQETVKELRDNFSKAKSVVFADIQGLKARDIVLLRRKAKEAKASLKVAKKTLINLAAKEQKKAPAINPLEMSGEVAVLFSPEDPIAALKAAYNFSLTHESLKFIAGIFDNVLLNKDEVLAIAQLPGREQLLGRLVGSIASPLSGLMNVLQGNIKGLVYVLANVKK